MTRTSLKVIAVTAFCLVLVGTTRGFIEASSPDEPEYELDCRHRSVDVFPGGDYMLRLALVQMAVEAHTEAVLDAVEIPLRQGVDFTADIGCQTPREPSSLPGLGIGTGFGGSGNRRGNATRLRRLPEGFAGISLDLQLDGIYHGAHEGLHLLVFEDFDGHCTRFGPGYTSGGTCDLPVHCAAMLEDVPFARVYLKEGLALFAVVTSRSSEHVGEPGRLDAWRSAFEEMRHLEPVVDRAAIEDAVESLTPTDGHDAYRADDFLAFGPLLNLLGASFVLRDHASAAFARGLFIEEPDLLDRIRAAGLPSPEDHVSRRFLRHAGGDWLEFVTGWMIDPERLPSFPSFPAVHLRLLDLTDDPAVAAASVERLESLLHYTGVKSYVLGVESLGRTDAVQGEYARLRGMVVRGLPTPWNLVLRSSGWLLAYSLVVPLLALLVVSVRSSTTIRFHGVSRPLIVLLAIGSFLTLGEFPLMVLLLPVWWVLARRWLRSPGRHGPLERAMVWLALTLSTIEGLQAIRWFVTSPPIDAAAGHGLVFCWILVGLWIVADDRWRRPQLFQVFLVLLLVIDSAVAFGSSDDLGALGTALVVAALLSLVGFLVSGHYLRGRATPGEPAPG